MDAKPQRPTRSGQVHDENAPVESKKTLHQRYKSTSALTATGATVTGAARAVTKRTAFGDVSNVVKYPSKDDSALPKKGASDAVEKAAVVAPFNRPAQRPSQVSGLRTTISATSAEVKNAIQEKQPTTNNLKPVEALFLPVPVSQKGATVFKDHAVKPGPKASIDVIREEVHRSHYAEQKAFNENRANPAAPGASDLQPRAGSIASTHITTSGLNDPQLSHLNAAGQPTSAPRHYKSQPNIRGQKQVLRRTKSKLGDDIPLVTEVDGIGISTLLDAVNATATAERQLSKQHETTSTMATIDSASEHDSREEREGSTDSDEYHRQMMDRYADKDGNPIDFEGNRLDEYGQIMPPASPEVLDPVYPNYDPVKGWLEDEEDDDGYTTAPDSTTGGATTVILPKSNEGVRTDLEAAAAIVKYYKTQEEIDEEALDTTMAAEYGEDIFAYMREMEMKMLPNPHYMDVQAEIRWSMRSILVDWLVQVHTRFNLLPETLFLAVNYIDRFLSRKVVSLGKLQLVGATALFIAAKYEEVNCPSIAELVYMVEEGYTADEILKAERFMLTMLGFELGYPGPMNFLRRVSRADEYDLDTRTLSKYFLEVTIMDERFVGTPASFVAAGSYMLARLMLQKGDWMPAHAHYSGYTFFQLRPLVCLMVECLESPEKHHSAVFSKYADRRFKRASVFSQGELQMGFTVPRRTAFHLPKNAELLMTGNGYFNLRDDGHIEETYWYDLPH
ncbi:MAG: hypothetical protein M1825_003259 [Sarcosagium campestre]|nr:MAG: hypothetical protein M1825_003259 [Sarcosagium campestre]